MVSDLRALPLFKDIPEERLGELLAAFRPAEKAAGSVLFRPGDRATHFELLVEGEVTIEEEGAVRFQLRPLTPLGELGAFTGLPRSTLATAVTDVKLLSIPVGDLKGFFERHADLGFLFTRNLLEIVTEKLRRDRNLLADMRANIIRTQKAMKQMRELVLESPETEMSKPICETLEGLIDNNRRVNYRVTPPSTFAAHVRCDDGKTVRVTELSEGYLKLEGTGAELGATREKGEWTGVLVMPTTEILVGASVHRQAEDGVVMKLDPMVDEYKRALDDYITRVQLLDFVV